MASSSYPIRPGIYRHYKGLEYEVIGVGKHTENSEELVFYRALYGNEKLWARPASMFSEVVDDNGTLRFIYVRDK